MAAIGISSFPSSSSTSCSGTVRQRSSTIIFLLKSSTRLQNLSYSSSSSSSKTLFNTVISSNGKSLLICPKASVSEESSNSPQATATTATATAPPPATAEVKTQKEASAASAKPKEAIAASEKPKAPAKAPAKPLRQLMEEDVIPSLKSILEAQDDISELELSFKDNRLEGSFLKKSNPYSFWAFFPNGALTGPKGFSISSYGSNASTVEPFLIDEKRITDKHIVFWVRKRLAAQGIIPVWTE